MDLDRPESYPDFDPGDFLSSVEALPDQIPDAIAISAAVERLPEAADITSVAVLGVGGSAIAGDILSAGASDGSRVFIRTLRGYDLPGWVGPGTLVFGLSYSGESEETLGAFRAAAERGAHLVAISKGGTLAADAGRLGAALVLLPDKGLQPRAALGYLSVPMLEICRRIGIFDGSDALAETAKVLEMRCSEYSRRSPTGANRAKQLALRLSGLVPIVYGSQGISEVAAYRWKCQFNECSKVPSFHNSFSELTHNEIVGWSGPELPLALIVLRDPGEHPRISRRIDLTLAAIAGRFAWVEEVHASARSPLARLFDLISLGDFTSVYLGMLRGADPSAIEPISNLKRQLAGG
ncbi:MAG: bifunctional phosphoglucose/phosphomannose isomerase [Actinomycetota bacterium]